MEGCYSDTLFLFVPTRTEERAASRMHFYVSGI